MAQSVEALCEQLIKDSKLVANCNEFVQAVARKVAADHNRPEITAAFLGNADAIRGRFSTAGTTAAPFTYIGTAPDLATKHAADGHFVVGGLTSTEMTYIGRDKKQRVATMGHVVVVVPGGPSKARHIKLANGIEQPARGGYPYCYQGAANAAFRLAQKLSVDVVFPSLLLDKVVYAYITLKP